MGRASAAPPCPGCEGLGYNSEITAHGYRRTKCVVCNGLKVLPLNHYQLALNESGKLAGIRRAQRRR
jgi:hypothetical protein